MSDRGAGAALPRHAMVLTAGLGTRLQPLTSVRAKPAMPVAGVPLVERIAGRLAAAGVAELVLNLHHLPETVTTVADAAYHQEQRHRQQRREVQFAVVSRRNEAGNVAAHHVRQPADQRTETTQT